ncbi:filamentous hemagglutinin N-terminal domain-containing protein [Chroococcus sp. FPU101]|uniref:two-partner secretion domain-containing protein n=1 Tax=Chroococcus sp. FPU101 TaxID=1974212 RepID=UPI001A8C382D|nr:filamentous hemagglutinin N-terminal domain-containing protein [Chroococcus sp. FPU101]GFE68937.1 filamentous hemagglutinin family outer membrane protein [Chroococcus sp. FPU101]
MLITLLIEFDQPLLAQIIPDNTLGSENSIVNPFNRLNDRVEGGAQRGDNLFHSFSDFNVNEGRGVYFANPAGVENIFTRVTGSNRSDILGKLGVLGTANLLLLNPNGILFGSHASLDIQGSFLATTANAIYLGNEGFFSASQPDSSHLLSVNPGALFFNQVAQQSSNINSQANLSVGKDLTLVAAGNLNINGNIELNNGGNISLVSKGDITFAPAISVTSTGSLGGKITLNSQGMILVDGSSITTNSNSRVLETKGGDIEIIALSLELDNNAELLTTTSGKANAGDLWIQIANRMTLDGESILGSSIEIDEKDNTSANTKSRSGNIYLEAGTLILKNFSDIDSIYSGVGNSGSILLKVADEISLTAGSLIRSDISGRGNTGNIIIEAPNAVVRFDGRKIVEDENDLFVEASGLSTIVGINGEGEGNAGKIYINAKSISLTNGAAIISSVFGKGNAGNIDLKVTDSLTISEGSRLLSFIGGIGDAGDITVDANNAKVIIDGIANITEQFVTGIEKVDLYSGIITVIARNLLTNEGEGKGGDIQITARTLSITNGAQIFTNNLVRGSSGNIFINVSDSLLMNGGSALRTDIIGQGIAGSITINAPNANLFFDGIADIPFYNTNGELRNELSPSGVSSNIRAALGIEGEGEAKDINITAKSLTLNNGAAITATTIRNQGGNITLNLSDRLLLRNQSNISATAGLAEETGDGGNITIDSHLILAIPKENSDITANAFQGKGGHININTKGIFGIQFREAQTPLSDITASSRFDVQGTVTITNPNDTLVNRLGKFTENIVDVARLVAKNVCSVTAGEVSSFIIKGRGGLPTNPSDPMMPNSTVDWATRSQLEKKPAVKLKERSDNTQPVIQQVQGWKREADGTIVLTAEAITLAPVAPVAPPSCH